MRVSLAHIGSLVRRASNRILALGRKIGLDRCIGHTTSGLRVPSGARVEFSLEWGRDRVGLFEDVLDQELAKALPRD